MASTEIIDIIDKNNNVIGSADVNTAHEQKLMHRVVICTPKNGHGIKNLSIFCISM